MKVKQLIKKLSQLDPNSTVMISADSEGNQFNELIDLSKAVYFYEENEIITKDEAQDFFSTDTEEEANKLFDNGLKDGSLKPVVVLWP